ncbi:MAG TPA: dienelactone hydrolase family protein, partial [Cellvibrionaceae bacterium]
ARQARPEAQLLLAGFSFGSAIAAAASHQLPEARHLTLVAPPVERYAYERDGRFPCPVSVVMGDKDELVNAPGVYDWVEQLASPVKLIRYPQAGHFFHGGLSQLKSDLSQELLAQLNL